MWLLAALSFPDDGWRGPVALALLAAAGVTIWSYAATPANARRTTGLVLKLLGLALLALCALEPRWTSERAKPGANFFAVLADNSRSLTLVEAGETMPRSDQLKGILDPERSFWQASLAENFEVRRYVFDSGLQAVPDFSSLDFQGRVSGLGSALTRLRERFTGRPLAGVILLSDGNATDLTTAPSEATGLPPLYPVILGEKGPARDLALTQVTTSTTAFEDAPVTIKAEATAVGYAGKNIRARVLDAHGGTMAEQKAQAAEMETRLSFQFDLKPEKLGVSFYRLKLEEEQATGEGSDALPQNNQRVVVVDRGQGPYRILYVAGRPNWEFKFLNRALASDPQLELASLIRVANREPKFDFRGRAGETSNPLFRGFGNQSREEAGSYDEPVIIRLNTRDEVELRSGFPSQADELFSFHALIFDDIEAGFFSQDQAQLVQRFVSERGGGLLMLGGMESFREGGYARTPIGETLPVRLDGLRNDDRPASAEAQYVVELDREGWLHPWARLRPDEASERARYAALPPVTVLNRVSGIKPGAGLISIARAPTAADEPLPALAVQRFGHGRTAAWLAGDLWRWGMKSPEARADMDQAWRQLIRWLIADTPDRVSISIEPGADSALGAVTLRVRVRDASYQPVENANVTLSVACELPADASASAPSSVTLPAEPALDEPGLYEATFTPPQSGGYRVEARALNTTGAEEGRAHAGWASDLDALEFAALMSNRPLLEALARQSGGKVLTPAELEGLTHRLPHTSAPVMELVSQPLWHTPWVFLAALACLLGEWGLRRTSGLP